MAGHSKWSNIQHRKGRQDKLRAKLFTKLVREIITSAKIGGVDPDNNPRLRRAISDAKSQNLPKERIKRGLALASDPSDVSNYSEIRYEGFMPDGVAIIVEALTENKNRTAAEIRSAFSKYGGNLGETGSVSFMFDRLGVICYPTSVVSADDLLEVVIDAGANDVESNDDVHIVYTDVESFANALEYLTKKYGNPVQSTIEWKPQNVIIIEDQEQLDNLQKLIDVLEDNEDVQNVFGNYQPSEKL